MTFNKRTLGGLMALILFLESFGLAGAQAPDMRQYKAEAGYLASRQGNYNFLQNAGVYKDSRRKYINADEKAVTRDIATASAGSPAENESAAVKETVPPSDTVQEPAAVLRGDEAVPAAEEAAMAIGIPGNIKVSAGERTIAVNWDSVPGAQGYELSLNGSITRVIDTYFTYDKQEANTQYFFKVRAFSEDKAGEWSREQECHTLLSAPVGLSATQSGISVELAWQPSKGAAGYRIYRNDIEIGYSAVNTYTDIRLEDFDTYIYRVKAVNEAGNASELSEVCRVENTAAQQVPGTVAEPAAPQKADSITPAGIKVPETQNMEVLPAPSDLTAKASCDSLLVSFSPVDGAESYEVSLDDNIISTTGSSLIIDNLTSNTRHVLKVRALSSQGNSEWGDLITIYTLLAPPSRLVATVSGTAINLTWEGPEGAATYEVYRNDIRIGTSDTGTYTDMGLSYGQTYVYTVKAFSAEGNESELSSASASCEIVEVPDVPADINVISTDKTITISFQPSDRAAGYDISLNGVISHTSEPGCTIAGLTPNQQYTVRVRAVNGGGSSQWSSEIYKYTMLSTPENIEAVSSMTSVELKWSPVEDAACYEIYRDETKIGTAASNVYNDTGLLQGKTYTYRIKAKNETGNESAYSAAVTAATLAVTYIGSDMKLTEDKVFGDVYLNGGTLDLNGYKMTVRGSLIQPGGVLKINGGQLIVAGDYRIQTENKQSDGSITYSKSVGYLYMTNPEDYILVVGSFAIQTAYENSLTAGVMEVKGDFIQKYGGNILYNFAATGTHKVLLSGNNLQTVSFEFPGYSCFNNLELQHAEGIEIRFLSAIKINGKFETKGCKLTGLAIVSWKLTADGILNGDLEIVGSTLDVAGHNLEVKGRLVLSEGNIDINHGNMIVGGNMIQPGGTMRVNGGRLTIAGDYRIQTENKQSDGSNTYSKSVGYLYMTNPEDYILVVGSFAIQTAYENSLTAGVMEVKGDFINKYGGNTLYNFAATGTHKVLLSGNNLQTVSFEFPGYSCFNNLELQHAEGIEIRFSSAIKINGKFETKGCKLTGLTIVSWKLTADEILNGDLEIVGSALNVAGYELEIKGRVVLSGGDIDINHGKMIVGGNMIQPGGTMRVNGGRLTIAGDYRIQTENRQSDGSITYSRSVGYLYMTNPEDYILVVGSFAIQTAYENSLTAGVMEVKGDFIHKYGGNALYNFAATGTHKVLLSGNNLQTVSFEFPGYSCFNNLELQHAEGIEIRFSSAIKINGKFETKGCKLTGLTIVSWKLTADEILNGDLEIVGSALNVAGYELEIKGRVVLSGGDIDINHGKMIVGGNMIQPGGTMRVNGGRLTIAGDYRIQTENRQSDGSITYSRSVGYLYMTNPEDYILVGGSFAIQTAYENSLTAGVMEVKGDFIHKYGGNTLYNFTATGTHKVLLSGNNFQTVSFEFPGSSKFNILIITKPLDSGYSFNSYSVWNVLIEDYRYQQYFGQSGTNPATGNFSRSYTDLTMEAPGYDINFTRTYNSRSSKASGFGKGWSFSYEGSVRDAQNNSNAKEVSLPDGSVQSFKKNSDGSFTAGDSHNILVKNPDGTYTLTSKQQDVFSFDTNGYLVKIQDKNGNCVTITVDSQGKATGVTDQAGRHFTVSYENSLIKNIKDDTNNRTISYEYTGSHLACVTDAMGNKTRYVYDTEGQLVEIRDSLDSITEEVSYISSGENKGKVNRRTDANGNTFTYTYDNINCVTTITDSNARVTREKYDGSYSIINSTDAEGKSTIYEYSKDANGINKYGEEKAVTDRNGNKTQYDRDSNGNVTKVTNPDSSTKVITYDDKNNITSERDENGKYTFYVYDSGKKNLIKKVQPLNGTDQYLDGSSDISKFAITVYAYYQEAESQALGYRARGLLKSETDPEGNTVTYTYDAYGNIKTRTDAEGNTSTFQYNTQSQVTAAFTPKGNSTAYIYDKNGNLEKQVTDGDKVTRITYDSEGRKTKEISPGQYEPSKDDIQNHRYNADVGYRYTYLNNGRIKTATDPENYTTAYTYDIYGNMETETKPNSSKYIYQYDLLNRPLRTYFKADASEEQMLLEEYAYEILAGGKNRQTCKQYLNDIDVVITVRIYDYAGRLLSETRPDGTTVATAYNANGTINYTTDANGNITYYKYDGLNRQTEQWTPFETVGGSTRYTYVKAVYDRAGKRLQEMAGSETVLQNQIPAGFITKTYDYYQNGKIKSITDNEGRRTEYLYDADGNVSRERVYASAAEYKTTYYDNNYLGKVTDKREYVKAGDLEGDYIDGTQDVILTTTCTYDKNGNLETMTAPDMVTTTYTYDSRNKQTSAAQPGMDENGNPADLKTTTIYNWQGQPLETVDANGNTTRYSYDKRGQLVKITDAANNTTAYYYDRAGRKTAEVAPVDYEPSKSLENMNRVEYAYDLMGRIKTKTYIGEEKRFDPAAKAWTTRQVTIVQSAYKYDSSGNLVKELDSLGYEAASDKTGIDTQINTGYGTEYTYNLASKVTSVLDPVSKEKGLGYTTKYGYDALGRRVAETNANGAVTSCYYDGAGNIIKITVRKTANDPEQTMEAKTWDFQGKLLTETDANGNVITYEYNAFGQIRKALYPGDASIPPNEITCLYDEMGRLKTQKDSKGAVDTYIYNSLGDVLEHTQKAQDNTEAITVYYSYDKNGNLRYSIDGNGNETEYIYNKLNKLAAERRTVSGTVQETSYTYDANGNQTAVTDWRGNTTAKSYDGLNRFIETKDAYGISIQKLEYNHNNSQEKAYDALNGITRYSYDRNNRLVSEISPESKETSWTYDNAGNLETKKDGKNNSTAYTYDEHNRLKTVTNAKNETTVYTYDPNGNLLSQTDAKGSATTYEYNAANKATKRIDQGGRTGTQGNYTYNPEKTETYTYNADGSLASKADRNGITTAYAYDMHGRLLSETAGEESITYTYDKNGNRLTMTDGTGTTARTYDELNRVLTKEVPNIGKSLYAYDIISGMETGCWAETAADPKGNVTKKEFDRTGRLKTVTADGKTTIYSYFDNGARQSVSYSDGSGEEYTYTPDGLLQTLTNKKADGSIIDTYSYTYDAANNQTSKTDARGTTVYTYDALNRLETATEPNGTVTAYTYDKAGNRETETIRQGTNTTLSTYSYNEQNRLLQVTVKQNGTLTGTTEYTYDSNGNQLTTTVNGTVNIINSYDLRNQLVRTVTSTATVENRYNGEGYRVEKRVNGAITRYLYEYDKVVLETDGAGHQTGRNVYGTNLLMRTADGTSYYYMYNGHADVTALLKPDGTIAATYYYDAFGNITDTTGSASNSITYAGYQYDRETGLYYLNARMYDPKTARFIQEDTYRGEQNDPLSLNLYTYCSNEPLMYTDPTGHSPLSWFKSKIDTAYDKVAAGAKKVGKKLEDTWDYVSDKAGEAWDTSTSYVSEKASEAYTSLKNDAKAVKQWAKTQATNTKEGFTALTNSKKRKEAFETIDTYGSESDKILARVAAGTAVVAGTTAVAATAVYAAPLIAAAGASVTTSIMSSSAATFAVANAEAIAWGAVGLIGGGAAVKSDIQNKEYGQIPVDLATAVLGGLMLKRTANSYSSTVGVKPNVGVNGGSRLKPNYQQFADDAGVGEVNNIDLSGRGYRPQPGERTLEGFVKNNVTPEAEIGLYTKSAGFNNNSITGVGEQFKRFGANPQHGINGPHVHQPTRGVNAKTGEIYGSQGSKTANGGVTSPSTKDVKQLYDYIFNGKYQK
ncbi:tRNA(Glu)-specific nuclease WapA precursor [Ruminiclostridium hungatei]|uniref:tRNA(Glu)-specific nuclease WapA n=1 Tax=Ruminiclostridium hungatei TaxID=48256 RepID=A0A1V4SH04_RUMHU|nr:RHS repeat-associated core domain-containing protein [Ruminiclostridium hungatei]OPX42547.1 tRNA(Glu)-specific nuclease WapA precursor [Ruminiclostridium hungatei]